MNKRSAFLAVLWLLFTISVFAQYRVYVANSQDNTISVIDTATNRVVATIDALPSPSGVAASPDGARIYVTHSTRNYISVIDTRQNRVIATITVGDGPTALAVTPDGASLYIVRSGNMVSVIDTATNKITATITVGSNPRGIAITPDGAFAYVTNSGNGNVTVIDTTKNVKVDQILVAAWPQGIAITPNGESAYIATGGADIIGGSVIDIAAKKTVAHLQIGLPGLDVALTPDGTFAYIIIGSNGVSVIRTTDNHPISRIPFTAGCYGYKMVVTPDGRRAYTSDPSSNSICVIDTTTNTVIATVAVGRVPSGVAILAVPE